jgi:hypothetical protein
MVFGFLDFQTILQFGCATGKPKANNDKVHTFTRIYLVDRVLYQTMVISPIAGRYPDTSRVLDSFKLIAHSRK